jgi:hypothetical protein
MRGCSRKWIGGNVNLWASKVSEFELIPVEGVPMGVLDALEATLRLE